MALCIVLLQYHIWHYVLGVYQIKCIGVNKTITIQDIELVFCDILGLVPLMLLYLFHWSIYIVKAAA